MNRSRRRRFALRVLAVMLGLGAIGFGGVSFADTGSTSNPDVVIAPTDTGTGTSSSTTTVTPNDWIWL